MAGGELTCRSEGGAEHRGSTFLHSGHHCLQLSTGALGISFPAFVFVFVFAFVFVPVFVFVSLKHRPDQCCTWQAVILSLLVNLCSEKKLSTINLVHRMHNNENFNWQRYSTNTCPWDSNTWLYSDDSVASLDTQKIIYIETHLQNSYRLNAWKKSL